MGSSKKPNKQIYGEKQNIITLTPGNIVKSQSQQEQSKINKDNTHYTQQTQCTHTTNTVTLAVCTETTEFIKQGNGVS